MDDYTQTARKEWVLKWPGQTILCISLLYWTKCITEAFPTAPQGLIDYIDTCNKQLHDIVQLVRAKLTVQNRTTLGVLYQHEEDNLTLIKPRLFCLTKQLVFFFNLEALVTLDVHARDVLTKLHEKNVRSSNDFKWLCHLRYYWLVSIMFRLNFVGQI